MRGGLALALAVPMIGHVATPTVAAAVPTDQGYVTTDLRCVTFVDGSTGYAAGASGVVLKSTDAGLTWHVVRSGGSYDFRSVSFVDAQTGWVVSLAGQVFSTTDGGTTWNLVSEDLGGEFFVLEKIYDAKFWSSTSGFAVGGAQYTQPAVWRTSNGGVGMWGLPSLLGSYEPPETQDPYPRDGLGYFYGIDMVGTTRAWAVGQDVFKTPYLSVIWMWNGSTWTQQSVTGTGRLLDVSFASLTNGVAVGDGGAVRYTTNGGTTWSVGTSGFTGELAGVAMTPTGTGWAVGQSGKVLRTDNNGATWAAQTSNTALYLEDVAWLGGGNAVAVGRSGEVIRTTDGGATWTRPAVPVPPAPQMTSLSSATHPLGVWTPSADVNAVWTASGTSITGYGAVVDTSPSTTVSTQNTTATSLSTTVGGSGVYYVHVAARDAWGQWSSTWHRQLLVDVTKPTVTDDAIGPYTGAARITLTAADAHSGVAAIEYSVDGDTTQTVSASQAAIDFGVGSHTLSYRALDNAGNASNATLVDVDVAPPAAPQMTALDSASHPAGVWVSSATIDVSWTASGTDLVGYGVVVDASPTTAPTSMNTTASSLTTTVAGSGTYYVHVAAEDAYAQWSTPWHRQVLVDVTPPLATDDAAGPYVRSARITITASDAHSGVAAIEYSVDGDTTQTVDAGQATVDLGVGEHTIAYRAVDVAGNASGTVNLPVTVDLPPAPQILGVTSPTHPAGQWVSSTAVSASWTAAGTDIAGYGVVLDESAVTTPTIVNATATSTSTVVPGSGTYYLHVAPRDTYGQWGATWHQQLLVDVTAPSAFDDALSEYTGAAHVAISATDAHSGVAYIEYRIDGGSVVSIESAQAGVDVGAGVHELDYRAIDQAGNTSGWISRTITVQVASVAVAGVDRYATALAACDAVFPGTLPVGPDGYKTVVVASGLNWPDALAATGLAGAHRGPLLLTKSTALPAEVGSRIRSLGADRVIVVGGTTAVNNSVVTALEAIVGTGHVARIGLATRYLTAAEIARATTLVPRTTAWDGTALVSTGGNFPDALAAGPIAASQGWPLYLAEAGGISATTVGAMKAAGVKRVYILGGTAAVPAATASAIQAAGMTVAERWDGATRYATGARIATESLERGLVADTPAIATGQNFPDALAGGVMQGLDGSVLVLTTTDALSAEASAFLLAHKSVTSEVRFLGGLAAVSQQVRDAVMAVVAF